MIRGVASSSELAPSNDAHDLCLDKDEGIAHDMQTILVASLLNANLAPIVLRTAACLQASA